ncbi:uncharacterized protein K452DRAFT_256590 [Aplosporella prunicola CBS 121167]|uniref:Uncharacterized protein n=1 Tax=Aplosporella prunicola CBS 121167 TaxID=1176127 RepID=A0A6A6B428_9PEZI|nr:uncharacterized protein K452DRAFT_256590 [Aplosporella prunicola CBS 121167]KAF2138368.1 hypothetical protein K452DRAFT_256590 [Aplosporella prunicola CBS 121167]
MQAFEDGVYTGSWTNWDRGRVRGATITLGKKNGQVLTAVLALFVTAAGTSFFRLACFAMHRALSSREPQDAVYHQRQAVLRNSATGASGVWKLVQVVWSWRFRGQNALARLFPSILCAALITSAFVVAGIFTSRISVAPGDKVLLAGVNCGIYYRPADDAVFLTLGLPYWSSVITASAGHAQQCFDVNSSSLSQNCATYYVKDALPYSKELDVECPFAEELCLNNGSAIRFDTGHLNSHSDFGVNAPPEDRVSYRQVLTCAPLTREGFTNDRVIPEDAGKNNETQYFYGSLTGQEKLNTTNLTWWSPREPIQEEGLSILRTEYGLSVVRHYGGYPDSEQPGNWLPLPELRHSDANTFLVAIEPHTVQFVQPVDDPVFSAHRRSTFSTGTYLADYTEGVVACRTQHQMCAGDAADGNCTPLTTQARILSALNTTFPRAAQYGSASSIFSLFTHVNLEVGDTIAGLKAAALHARRYLDSGVQGPLPPDQWQREVELWWRTALTVLQMSFTEQATGPGSEEYARSLFRRPETAGGAKRCVSQMVRSAEYTSFSTLGLGLVFGLGGLLVLLSWSVEPLVNRFQKNRRKNVYRRLEWAANGTLQLQRLAHEELGLGSWGGGAELVPTTQPGQKLALVRVADAKHPTLVSPDQASWEEDDDDGDKESQRSVIR